MTRHYNYSFTGLFFNTLSCCDVDWRKITRATGRCAEILWNHLVGWYSKRFYSTCFFFICFVRFPLVSNIFANSVSRILALSSHSVVRRPSSSVTSNIFSTIWCFRPYKLYIFWKLLVQGYQNWYYQVSHAQIHKYKYTNTQIQHMTKCQKDSTCGIFLDRGLFKDIKNHIPMCWTHKYKNTNTQLHKYSIIRSARKTQHVVYFWKEDFSRISKIIFPCAEYTNTKIQIQKYTNKAYDEVPERSNMWYIFGKRIVHCLFSLPFLSMEVCKVC